MKSKDKMAGELRQGQHIYNGHLYYIVIATCILTYLTSICMLIKNLVKREMMKLETPEIVWRSTNLCLWCLCALHIFTILNVTAILVEHLDFVKSYGFCEAIDDLMEVGVQLSRTCIWLVLEFRYRIMSNAYDASSKWSRVAWVITKVMVICPLLLLPFELYHHQDFSHLFGGSRCIVFETNTIVNLKMWGVFAISLIFLVIFLIQMWKAIRKIRVDDMPHYAQIQQIRGVTGRNVFIMSCIILCPIIYWGPLRIIKKNALNDKPDSVQLYVDLERLVRMLDFLIDNVVLYLVFRNWSYFLLDTHNLQNKREKLLSNTTAGERLDVESFDSRVAVQSASIFLQSQPA